MIKTKVLVVAFLLGAFVNYANNTDLNNVLNAEKVTIEFNDVKEGHILTIKDNYGTILYSENVITKGKLVKNFDFSKLKNGNYSFELNKDFEIIVKTLEVKNKKVIFNEGSKKVIFKPVIRNKKNILMISQIAFDKKPTKVVLFFDDEIIYSETIKGEVILNRVYKLDKEVKGNYKVIIYNNNRSYVHDFII
tara:strand:+ start:5538 stop:6113 length:576 start_codon:yes stop_codon:yes gene_type:complete